MRKNSRGGGGRSPRGASETNPVIPRFSGRALSLPLILRSRDIVKPSGCNHKIKS